MRFSRFRSRRSAFIAKAALLLMVLCAGVAAVDFQLRPIIKSMASSQARLYATKAINNAISTAMLGKGVAYENLVSITTDASGSVTSVQTDMVKLNLLKAEVTDSASVKISQLQEQKIRVPLGSLLGSQILAGRGPRVEFRVIPTGFVDSTLVHKFDKAGINQTRHQIILEIKASVIAILPGYTSTTEIITNVMLAETVIVGPTPQGYTEVITGNNSGEDLAGIIENYGNGN